jgi:hypothetical protein
MNFQTVIETITKIEGYEDQNLHEKLIQLIKKACVITNLSESDLLHKLDFQPNNLTNEMIEGFLAQLRAIFWLKRFGFSNITPIEPKRNFPQPDFRANYKDKESAIEVFCLTKTHEQQKDQTLNVYVNFNPQFEGSKFGRDFISKAPSKKIQLDSISAEIKVLLCVINSTPIIALNDAQDIKEMAKFLYHKLNWGRNYFIGLLTGWSSFGVLDDTIYPDLY